MEVLVNDEQIIEIVNKKIENKLKNVQKGIKVIDKMEDPNILHTFLTTLQYLLDKFEIVAPYQSHLPELIRLYTENRIGDLNDKVKDQVNNLLFNRNTSIIEIQEKLDKNYNTNLSALSSLLDANYHRLETPRNLFVLPLLQDIEKSKLLAQSLRE